jgi:transglycosylase-like protein with SLT domain
MIPVPWEEEIMTDLVQRASADNLQTRTAVTLLTVLSVVVTFIVSGFRFRQDGPSLPPLNVKHMAPADFFECELRMRINAPVEVALVFGRALGCQNADASLINLVAREAVKAGVPPKVLAATVAVESQCDPHAASSRGALGLTQVLVRAWDAKSDFSHVNLLNPSDNARTGAIIMAELIRENGLPVGLQRYNGATSGCPTCDSGYSARVLALAGITPRQSRACM